MTQVQIIKQKITLVLSNTRELNRVPSIVVATTNQNGQQYT